MEREGRERERCGLLLAVGMCEGRARSRIVVGLGGCVFVYIQVQVYFCVPTFPSRITDAGIDKAVHIKDMTGFDAL